MKLKLLFQKIDANPWFKIVYSLFIIGTSLYDILQDISKFRKEHVLFTLGLFLLLKSIWELIDKIKGSSKEAMAEAELILKK